MNGRIFFRIILALVLVAGLVGLGVFIYNTGVSQGLAASGKLVAPDGGAVPYAPYAPYFYRPWGFGFFPFGFIFPLLFFLLIFAAIRGAFFRGWRWGNRGGGGPDQVPPMFEEWHRKMHENQPDDSSR
jgi:hypothetical protein